MVLFPWGKIPLESNAQGIKSLKNKFPVSAVLFPLGFESPGYSNTTTTYYFKTVSEARKPDLECTTKSSLFFSLNWMDDSNNIVMKT